MTKSREAFRTIGEVSEWLDTPAHVLRFWESKFPQIRPVKRAGGRRYYRPDDMALLGGIKTLLHEQGMTIKGVQKMLREQGVRHVAALGPSPLDVADGEWLELGPEDAPEAEATAATAPLPEVVEVVRPAAPSEPAAAPRPAAARQAAPPRPGILGTLVAADPARIAARRARIAPLVARLSDLRGRMARA